MLKCARRLTVAAGVALVVISLSVTTVHAAPPAVVRVLPNSQSLVNPYFRVAPGLSLNQYAYNVGTLGRAYSYVPPYVLGYNPYPVYVNYGPVYPTIGFYNPYLRNYQYRAYLNTPYYLGTPTFYYRYRPSYFYYP
jgi:hypothetical protein